MEEDAVYVYIDGKRYRKIRQFTNVAEVYDETKGKFHVRNIRCPAHSVEDGYKNKYKKISFFSRIWSGFGQTQIGLVTVAHERIIRNILPLEFAGKLALFAFQFSLGVLGFSMFLQNSQLFR